MVGIEVTEPKEKCEDPNCPFHGLSLIHISTCEDLPTFFLNLMFQKIEYGSNLYYYLQIVAVYIISVSYTHLDVYKRQLLSRTLHLVLRKPIIRMLTENFY